MSSESRATEELDVLVKIIEGFLTLMCCAFVLRLISRVQLAREFGRADWTMTLAFSLATTASGLLLRAAMLTRRIYHGFDTDKARLVQDLGLATSVSMLTALTFTRLSFGFFFLSIFNHKRSRRIFIWSTIISSSLLAIVAIPMAAIRCNNNATTTMCARPWASSIGYINASNTLLVLYTLTLVIGDFGFAIMGILALWQIQIPRFEKIPVGLLLCLGLVGAIFSLIRLQTMMRIWIRPADPAMDSLIQAKWTYLEVSVGVICGNLVFIKPLIHWVGSKAGLITLIRQSRSYDMEGVTSHSGIRKSVTMQSGDVKAMHDSRITDPDTKTKLVQIRSEDVESM